MEAGFRAGAEDTATASTTALDDGLPVGSVGRKATGWWGMWGLIASEAALFAYLLFSYYYLAAQAPPAWRPEKLPELGLALPNTFILIASSFAVGWGENGIKRGNRKRLLIGLGTALAMGGAFAGVQTLEWRYKPFGLSDGAYGSLYYTTTGFHLAHVVGGLLILLLLLVWTALGYFGAQRHAAVSIGAAYWHFVDLVWLAVFGTYYLYPYLG
jgi:cytochrome c oxidase subunit 3